MSNKMKFCPRCATPLSVKNEGGRDRIACPDGQCGFTFFGDFSIGCSGVVLREEDGVNTALLVQRGQEPFAGMWQLPGGYAEHDEPLSLAVEREVHEESSIRASVRDVIGFRHMSGGAVNNIYMIFRLDYIGGEPRFDGEETAGAGFFSLAEMEGMEGVQNISRWGIEQALVTTPDSGLSVAPNGPGADRPGWSLFGLSEVDPSIWR
ncbi:MAG: NUDIX domain-containing protein [Chromatiales bacterium]|nr:NUDIX domain-containing protein [Chromatiales bacterium]